MKEKHEKTRKTPGLAVNKTLEIRRVARQMVAAGKPPRPIEIVARLEASGIDVTGSQVSTALARTEFAFRRNRDDWENPRPVLPDPLECVRQTSRQNLEDAAEFARKIGSLEGAIASLVALGQLKREPEQREQYYGGA